MSNSYIQSLTLEQQKYSLHIWMGDDFLVETKSFSPTTILLKKKHKYKCRIDKYYKCRTIKKEHYNGKHPFRAINDTIISVSQEEYTDYYQDIMGGVIARLQEFDGWTDTYFDIWFEDFGLVRVSEIDGFENHFIPIDEWRQNQIEKII